MANYIDVLLTSDGRFCVAPPWVIQVGDLICVPDELGGEDKIREVVSVATDSANGEHYKQIEKYIGYPLPKINAKYSKSEVVWNEPVQE